MIKNILIDLDDTLLDFHKAEKIALKKTLLHFEIEPTEYVIDRYKEINQAQWKLLEEGKLTQEQVKLYRYQLLFEELDTACSAEMATKYYERMLGIGHYFVEGAEELLKRLYGIYHLYLASNGIAGVQHSRIASAGIEKYLDGIFISEEAGAHKPSPDFFAYCFTHIAGFKKEETVILGDSLTSDIRGGNNAGIKTIWYNPKGTVNDRPEIQPDFVIQSLYELDELLKEI